MRIRARQAMASPNGSWQCPSPSIWLGLFASLLVMVGGIWDIAWHQTLGRDTFWSPPHLLAIGAVGAIRLGLIVALVTEMRRAGHAGRRGPLQWSWRGATLAEGVLEVLF